MGDNIKVAAVCVLNSVFDELYYLFDDNLPLEIATKKSQEDIPIADVKMADVPITDIQISLDKPNNNNPETSLIGRRVLVPLGNRTSVGIILKIKKIEDISISVSKLKYLSSFLDPYPILKPSDLELILFASNYYQENLTKIFKFSIPKKFRDKKDAYNASKITAEDSSSFGLRSYDNHYIQNAQGLINKNSKIKHMIIQTLRSHAQEITLLRLFELLKPKSTSLTKVKLKQNLLELIDKNIVIKNIENRLNLSLSQDKNIILNEAQNQAASKIINSLNTFNSFLLYGVTASGKTEVYIKAIQATLEMGKQIVFLVPEIGLIHQTFNRIDKQLGVKPLISHSQISDKEKVRAWQELAQNKSQILLCTRSGLFYNFANLGLCILDEEHDSSYKQQGSFHYNARDLLLYKAKLAKAPVILGSATPSFESLHNVKQNKLTLLNLPNKAANQPNQTKIKLIPQNNYQDKVILDSNIINEVKDTLARNKQVLFFINKRGFANKLFCKDCKSSINCNNCSSPMTYYKFRNSLICHHCGAYKTPPQTCPSCGSELIKLGLGTEKISDDLTFLFDSNPTLENLNPCIIRVDRDLIKNSEDFKKQLDLINSNQANLIVATQMISKGHHFENLDLVIILGIDNYLYSTDFRSEERLAQMLIQLIGRVGRVNSGKVLIPLLDTQNPVIADILKLSYFDFAEKHLKTRETFFLPPNSFQAILLASGTNEFEVKQFLEHIKLQLDAIKNQNNFNEVLITTPIPCILTRLNKKFRSQILMQSKSRKNLNHILKILKQEIKINSKIMLHIYVDPSQML